jgi:hypothetical protein
MRTNGRIAAFDIEMLFLQYVVSCIIENRNAFSDSLFIYSVVFHYRTPAGSQKRHRLFFFKRTVTPKLRRKITPRDNLLGGDLTCWRRAALRPGSSGDGAFSA